MSRQWHAEHVPGGIAIGEDCSSFARRVIMINPTEKDFYTRHGRTRAFVLHFGAYGWTRLHV